MKGIIAVVGLTVANALVHLRPPPSVEALLITPGTLVPSDLIPGVAPTCSLLVFFDPECPFCEKVAESQASFFEPPLPMHWVTDDIRHGPTFMEEHLPDVDLMMSEALPAFFGIRGVPSAAWVKEGRVVATGVLSGRETADELRGRCEVPDEPPLPDGTG